MQRHRLLALLVRCIFGPILVPQRPRRRDVNPRVALPAAARPSKVCLEFFHRQSQGIYVASQLCEEADWCESCGTQEYSSTLKSIAVIQVAETGDRGKTRLGGKRCVPLSFPLHQRTPAQGQVVTTVQTAVACEHPPAGFE